MLWATIEIEWTHFVFAPPLSFYAHGVLSPEHFLRQILCRQAKFPLEQSYASSKTALNNIHRLLQDYCIKKHFEHIWLKSLVFSCKWFEIFKALFTFISITRALQFNESPVVFYPGLDLNNLMCGPWEASFAAATSQVKIMKIWWWWWGGGREGGGGGCNKEDNHCIVPSISEAQPITGKLRNTQKFVFFQLS